jgi:hypothetical protein
MFSLLQTSMVTLVVQLLSNRAHLLVTFAPTAMGARGAMKNCLATLFVLYRQVIGM